MSVAISANEDVPLDIIKDFVKEKGPWICKNINYFRKFQPDEKSKKK